MIRPMRPAHARPPKHRAENEHRQREEHACNLKPHNSAYAPKRLEKSPHAASRPSRCLARNLPGCAALRGTRHRDRASGNRICRRLGTGRHALPGNAPGHAQPNAQCPADVLRFHFDSMVTVWLPTPLFDSPSPSAGCSWAALEVRLKNPTLPADAFAGACRRPWRYP
jgi:hypothetical protein